MKRRDFLAALGLTAVAATLPISVLEETVPFSKSDIQLLADFALRTIKSNLPKKQYEAFHTYLDGNTQLKVDLRWFMGNDNALELMQELIAPKCKMLAESLDPDITAFCKLPVPKGIPDVAAVATDDSNVSVRIIKEYDIVKDEMLLRIDVLVI